MPDDDLACGCPDAMLALGAALAGLATTGGLALIGLARLVIRSTPHQGYGRRVAR